MNFRRHLKCYADDECHQKQKFIAIIDRQQFAFFDLMNFAWWVQPGVARDETCEGWPSHYQPIARDAATRQLSGDEPLTEPIRVCAVTTRQHSFRA